MMKYRKIQSWWSNKKILKKVLHHSIYSRVVRTEYSSLRIITPWTRNSIWREEIMVQKSITAEIIRLYISSQYWIIWKQLCPQRYNLFVHATYNPVTKIKYKYPTVHKMKYFFIMFFFLLQEIINYFFCSSIKVMRKSTSWFS